ncbi:MAG: TSUP family transporter [Bacteroidetes bacterium]|nr:TSUP family transporter [Bacteroidota bacterium]
MEKSNAIILVIVGIFSGILSALVGVGGGIVIVPSLIYFLHFSQKQAQGTSLALILLPVGFLAVWEYYKQGNVNFMAVGFIALGFMVGSYFSAKFFVSAFGVAAFYFAILHHDFW